MMRSPVRPGLSATFDDQLSPSTAAGSVQYIDDLFRQSARYRERIVGNSYLGITSGLVLFRGLGVAHVAHNVVTSRTRFYTIPRPIP